ncbi:uncharacterized protein LOC105028325 isoform X2 [Esox lucius]|uniref:uncharacterized protein LOC105028325 isoform X2 n=1 Tax=Esox lucius TaxID=8010 RepID=UPI000576A482|nr:uncharacterized protein LOC105028325 isoform X2 [Esox lucius]
MWTWCLFYAVCSRHIAVVVTDVAAVGKAELQRVRNLAAQPRYGECWSRALENIDARCREFTADMQSRIALLFTHCHLDRSGRSFPACPKGSDVSSCTRTMDPVAFNTYTEFFTHAHSICHYLQSESWQQQAENTIHRLTASSAVVVEQLSSTQRLAKELVEAQGIALKSQQLIIRNGEELKNTLHHSTQGIRAVFDDMRHSAQEQQVAFSEIFNRVAFLQSFIMSESHTLSSLLYNSLGFLAAFFLTATCRTAPARLCLFGLVVLNVYLERVICRAVLDSSDPGYQQMERIGLLVGLLRRAMVLGGFLILVYTAVRYRNVTKESLEILNQLKETRLSLQLALHQAECLSEAVDRRGEVRGRRSEKEHKRRGESREEDTTVLLYPAASVRSPHVSVPERPYMSPTYDGWQQGSREETRIQAQSTQLSPGRRRRSSSISRCTSSSPLVYSVLVGDKQTRYNLRNRRSCAVLDQD